MVLDLISPISMEDNEFHTFRDFIHDYCGIYFDDDSKYLLEMRISKRLRNHNLANYRDYYYMLKFDRKREAELNDLIEILTTNETYLFREQFQLKAFSEEIIPEIYARKKREARLNIWSAGCSSGEEPYTIAILILESGLFDNWKVEIFASDISNRALSIARAGKYRESAFRVTSREIREKYFDTTDSVYQIKDRVKALVDFGRLNLMDTAMIGLLRTMDVIFCRNVIIYFDLEAKKKAINSFFRNLNEGGYLLLGHSESLLNITTAFKLVQLRNDLVYQKSLSKKGDRHLLLDNVNVGAIEMRIHSKHHPVPHLLPDNRK